MAGDERLVIVSLNVGRRALKIMRGTAIDHCPAWR